jgi:hypothetical protein
MSNTHSYIGNKIKNCIQRILNIDCSVIIQNNNDTLVYIYNLFISDILLELGNDHYKHLPEKYYCTDIDYINGLYDGLIGQCQRILLFAQYLTVDI